VVYTILNVWHNPVADKERFAVALRWARKNAREYSRVETSLCREIESCTQIANQWRYGAKASCSFTQTEETIERMFRQIQTILDE